MSEDTTLLLQIISSIIIVSVSTNLILKIWDLYVSLKKIFLVQLLELNTRINSNRIKCWSLVNLILSVSNKSAYLNGY